MFYKVVVLGTVIEYTRKKAEAESAFKEAASKDRQMWLVGNKTAQRVM